jgi:Zn-dependent peptidase ImmA (M78 family)
LKRPEVNLARRVIQKYQLAPPIDVHALASAYATVQILSLPVDLDGASINLKVPRRHPTIVLNHRRPPRRQRFTLAHELGHVLIPWHIGTIADDIDLADDGQDRSYWNLESEANRFAAELLMPDGWVKGQISARSNPGEMVEAVAESADVSSDAALIRVNGLLSPGYIYALIDSDGVVISSGRSNGTLPNRPVWGRRLDEATAFPSSDALWRVRFRDVSCIWWHFPSAMNLRTSQDPREWRQIMDDIFDVLDMDPSTAKKLEQTISGVFGYANSLAGKTTTGRTSTEVQEAVYAASMQRFDSRASEDPSLKAVVTHPDFSSHLTKRVLDLSKKKK